MKDKRTLYKVLFVLLFLGLLIFQWIPLGFIESITPFGFDFLEEDYSTAGYIAHSIIAGFFVLVNWVIQLGLPVFFFYKGFIKKKPKVLKSHQ